MQRIVVSNRYGSLDLKRMGFVETPDPGYSHYIMVKGKRALGVKRGNVREVVLFSTELGTSYPFAVVRLVELARTGVVQGIG